MSRSPNRSGNPFSEGKVVGPLNIPFNRVVIERGEQWLEHAGLYRAVPLNTADPKAHYRNNPEGLSYWSCPECHCSIESRFLTMQNLSRLARVGSDCYSRPNSSSAAYDRECACHSLPDWVSFGAGTVSWADGEAAISYPEPTCLARSRKDPSVNSIECDCGEPSLVFILAPEGSKWWWLCAKCAGIPNFVSELKQVKATAFNSENEFDAQVAMFHQRIREHIENALAMGWRPL